MSYNQTSVLWFLVTLIIFLLIIGAIIVFIVFLIKHLIKFTARTIYEEKARAEEQHTKNIQKTSEPEEDR